MSVRVIRSQDFTEWDVEVWNPSYNWWDYVRSFRCRWRAELFAAWFRCRS